MLMFASMLLMSVGSIMSCKQKADAPQKDTIEAAEEAPEMNRIEPADSAATADNAMQAQMERQYFEALAKIADGGKVYATDADGKRSPKAFTRFDDYSQFIADNPQYPKNHYSYDTKGKSFNVDFKTPSNGDGSQNPE